MGSCWVKLKWKIKDMTCNKIFDITFRAGTRCICHDCGLGQKLNYLGSTRTVQGAFYELFFYESPLIQAWISNFINYLLGMWLLINGVISVNPFYQIRPSLFISLLPSHSCLPLFLIWVCSCCQGTFIIWKNSKYPPLSSLFSCKSPMLKFQYERFSSLVKRCIKMVIN